MKQLISRHLSRQAPSLLRIYRQLKLSRLTRRFFQTPDGFELAGDSLDMASGEWERAERKVFLEQLKHVSLVVDVGANIGYYSVLAARSGKEVIAIEPLRENLDFLYANLLHNGLLNVEVFPLALSDGSGISELFGAATMASLVRGWGKQVEYQREFISTTTFDRLLSHRLNAVPTFIKIDVEGFEYEVLMGAKTILAQEPKPIWMVEIFRQHESIPGGLNKRFGHIFRLFWDHGYKSMAIGEQVTEVQDVETWENRPEYNFLFSASG
jgi:FkbM family methyltransferase